MRGLVVALQFFTRLPMPRLSQWREDDLASAAPWLPLVGLVIGAAIAMAFWAGAQASIEIASAAALFVWVRITGGLHLDGLADTADGLAAAHGDPARFLEVARDPNTGAFGVTAIVLLIALKALTLLTLARGDAGWMALGAIALVPAWARWAALVMQAFVPALGQGRSAQFRGGRKGAPIAAAVFGVLLVAASIVFAPLLIAAVGCAGYAARYWYVRLGGVSGDCHGATIEVVEVALLMLLAFQPALGINGLGPAGLSGWI